MHLNRVFFACLLTAAVGASAIGQTVPTGSFRVGAAKVDITPTKAELPKQFLGILDQLYARAIVIENGHTSAALISLDAGVVPSQLWQSVSSRMEKELGIPAGNILITATHTHSVPFGMNPNYADKVFESAKLAKEKLQPARISYGTGVSYMNVQRDMIDPNTHRLVGGSELRRPLG